MAIPLTNPVWAPPLGVAGRSAGRALSLPAVVDEVVEGRLGLKEEDDVVLLAAEGEAEADRSHVHVGLLPGRFLDGLTLAAAAREEEAELQVVERRPAIRFVVELLGVRVLLQELVERRARGGVDLAALGLDLLRVPLRFGLVSGACARSGAAARANPSTAEPMSFALVMSSPFVISGRHSLKFRPISKEGPRLGRSDGAS